MEFKLGHCILKVHLGRVLMHFVLLYYNTRCWVIDKELSIILFCGLVYESRGSSSPNISDEEFRSRSSMQKSKGEYWSHP